MKHEVVSADGEKHAYRMVSSRLQRWNMTTWVTEQWYEVNGDDFLRMTPKELRVVADCIENARSKKRVSPHPGEVEAGG